MPDAEGLRARILDLVREYHGEAFPEESFRPGTDYLAYAGRVFDADDMESLVDSALDFWLTAGRYANRFERELASYIGMRHSLLTNSGSSANLLAVSALTSEKLGRRQLVPGDEVITVAAGFPTTVNPIIQNQLVPVFCDVDLGTYNIRVEELEQARTSRTRAIVIAHTMGNPFNLDAVCDFADKHDLWLVEDNCDALGALWGEKRTGSFGELSTQSFYPAHHITTGEGGAVSVDDPFLKRIVESFRDWGRDCWCEPGLDNTCGKRFAWQLGDLPEGYDHKYIYTHLGYNLKATEMQAAVGVSQLQKLPRFVERRVANHSWLRSSLAPFEEFFVLPHAEPKARPSWFGFVLTIRPGAPFTRRDIVDFLEERNIATRMLFGGNLTRQPGYTSRTFRTASDLVNTDIIMERTFWIGVHPAMRQNALEYVGATFADFLRPFGGEA